MSIELPRKPGVRRATPRLLDFGGRLIPILGGPVQNLQRLGTRFSFEFELPPVRSEPFGREWVGKLAQAKLGGAIMPFLQDGFSPGAPGALVVDGAGQSGSLLAVRGGTRGYGFRFGQFVSLIHDGRRYLHMVTAPTRLDADGKATLPILPMLRVIPDDADQVEVALPKIEGSLVADDLPWDVTDEPFVELGRIRIDEDA